MNGVLLFSGGIDSTVVLALLLKEREIPYCLCLDYGQKCRGELDAAQKVMRHYDADGEVRILPPSLFAGSALTGHKELPKDVHFRDQAHEATYVPGRNLIFIALAVAEAQRRGLHKVYTGAHAPAGSIYRDATAAFSAAVNQATRIGYGVEVDSPLLGMTKTEIVQVGRRLGVPIEMTWSCYDAGAEPCGRCGQCLHRAESLAESAT